MKTAVLLASLVVAGSSSAWAAKAYTLRQLFDDPPNQPYYYSYATAIANTGWIGAVRGQVGGGGLAYRCRLGASCAQVPFNVNGGGRAVVEASGVNDNGVIVGSGPTGGLEGRGFKWDGVTMTYFEPFTDECLGCRLETTARAINRRGEVAGHAEGTRHYAVVFGLDNVATKLPDFGWYRSVAKGITNDGFVVGYADRADGTGRGWVYVGLRRHPIGRAWHLWRKAVRRPWRERASTRHRLRHIGGRPYLPRLRVSGRHHNGTA
jgi:hypothetical protein